jgi:hypothetical protein
MATSHGLIMYTFMYVPNYSCGMCHGGHGLLHVQNMELKHAHAKCGPFTTLTMNYDFLNTSIVMLTK